MSVATRRSISAGVIDVVPPLMWPTTSGLASSTTSALIGLLPAIDGPPVWIVTVMPCAFAHRTIGAASLPVFTEPRPISPTRRTPAAAISTKSASLMPSSRIGAPACTFTPPGRKFAYAFAATIASALRPTMSLGRPGRCTSPAEMAVVTPPCIPESMKSTVRCRGVKSPKTGCTCESISPGITVVPRASITVSASSSSARPTAAMRPSRMTRESASSSGRAMSPLTRVPMLRTRVFIARGPPSRECGKSGRRTQPSRPTPRCRDAGRPRWSRTGADRPRARRRGRLRRARAPVRDAASGTY